MSKFPNDLAERLYQEDADEVAGDSSEGTGWAGLYILTDDERAIAGTQYAVLVERTDGIVDFFRCATLDVARDLLSQYVE